MTELILSLCVVFSFIICMIIGCLIYKKKEKKVFNPLNTFPFEIEDKKDFSLTLLFRILLIVFVGVSCVDILYLFMFHFDADFSTKFLSIILLLEAFMLLGLFLVSTRVYKGHIIINCLFVVLNVIAYFILGVSAISNKKDLWLIITSITIGVILLVLLLLPNMKEGYKLDKVESEELEIKKKTFNFYIFNEWLNILFFMILLVISSVQYLL